MDFLSTKRYLWVWELREQKVDDCFFIHTFFGLTEQAVNLWRFLSLPRIVSLFQTRPLSKISICNKFMGSTMYQIPTRIGALCQYSEQATKIAFFSSEIYMRIPFSANNMDQIPVQDSIWRSVSTLLKHADWYPRFVVSTRSVDIRQSRVKETLAFNHCAHGEKWPIL